MSQGFTMPFLTALGAELVSSNGGNAEVQLQIRPEHRNAFGGAHGGVLAALLDIAVGAAAASDGVQLRPNVTLALTTQYLSAAPGEGMLIAYARRRGGGGQIAFVDAEVRGPDGGLLATGTATLRFTTA